MKTKIIILALLFSTKIFAHDPTNHPFGLGINAGQPMGVTSKYWLDKYQAIDTTLGFTLGSGNSVQLHADYLFHLYELLSVPSGKTPVYFGGGLRIRFADSQSTSTKNRDTRFGIRIPGGINYSFEDFQTFPFNLYAEIAPVFDIAPKVRVDMNYGVGGRFYFGI